MDCFIGIGRYRLDLAHCRSLKDKRQVMRSVVDRIGRSKNACASEAGAQDYIKTGVIVAFRVSPSMAVVKKGLLAARRTVETTGVEVLEAREWFFDVEDLEEFPCQGA